MLGSDVVNVHARAPPRMAPSASSGVAATFASAPTAIAISRSGRARAGLLVIRLRSDVGVVDHVRPGPLDEAEPPGLLRDHPCGSIARGRQRRAWVRPRSSSRTGARTGLRPQLRGGPRGWRRGCSLRSSRRDPARTGPPGRREGTRRKRFPGREPRSASTRPTRRCSTHSPKQRGAARAARAGACRTAAEPSSRKHTPTRAQPRASEADAPDAFVLPWSRAHCQEYPTPN